MEPSSARIIPHVFEKLLYYIAPADALAYGNAYWMLGPIACRQVADRLATPKKRMLLLAWPLCMHVREDASNYYREAEFYDILRTNVVKRSGGAVRSQANAAAETMRKFLTGFELLMLECVERNICFYNNLNVLMLDFHDPGGDLSPFRQSAPYQTMASERWGKVVGAVVARCAADIRHFMLVVGTCSELPDKFYTSLKLDSLLARMQQLETLYIPSVEAYTVAHSSLRGQRLCWQALHELPIEQRLPNLRRIVVGFPSKHSCTSVYLKFKPYVLASDAVAIHAAFSSDKVVNVGRTRSSKAKLPQFPHSLTASTKQQQLLVIEVADPSNSITYHDGDKGNFKRLLLVENDISSKTNITCYVGDENKLTLSHAFFSRLFVRDYSYHDDNFLYDAHKVTTEVEKWLLKVAKYRPQMLSIVNDIIVVDGSQTTAKIPACISADTLNLIRPDTSALLLSTLSSRLSSPLCLTLQLDWYTLLKHLALFTTSKENATLIPWSKSISRGDLKLELKISNSLLFYINDYYLRNQGKSQSRAQFDEMCRNNLSSIDNRYVFPLQVTIEISAPPLLIEFLNESDAFYMPSIRKHFRQFWQQFVDDTIVAADEPINNIDKPVNTRTLRADLYASCRKLVVHVEMCCEMPMHLRHTRTHTRHIQRMRKLAYDKQLEMELKHLFYNNAKFDEAKNDEKETQQLVMPNLKSVKILRQVMPSFY